MSAPITSVRITPLPEKLSSPMSEVWAKFGEDRPEEKLFIYFADEVSFEADELVGLTREQALRLKYTKDRAYLSS